MKHLQLPEEERCTLREIGVLHSHPGARMRAQGNFAVEPGLDAAENCR
jgi:hypothetical protein